MSTHSPITPEQSELGKKSEYVTTYQPDKLLPLSRQPNRAAIGIQSSTLPFYGFDYWNHYEVSWLNEKGKPIVALAEIIYGCESDNIIESKSMKLYFNSFNNSTFKDAHTLETLIQRDLSARINSTNLLVRLTPLSLAKAETLAPRLTGFCVDDLDVACSVYHADPTFLTTENQEVEETLYSDLLKSNCLVTNQPDWCSVQISYKGKKINREGLLKYIVSFRNDNEFHEQCMEKMFVQIMQQCAPTELTVYGRSTRRGGIDINSIRSSKPVAITSIPNTRLCRQ